MERTIKELKGENADNTWAQEREINFNHSVLEKIGEYCASVQSMKEMKVRMAEGKFAEEFGFSPSEVVDMKSRLTQSEDRLEV